MKNLYLLVVTALLIFSCSSENDSPIQMETCATPVITLTTISLEDATFSSTASTIQVEYGIEGFTLGTGTTIDVSANTFSISGLMQFKSYDLYAKAICTTTESEWFGPLNFVTQCDVDNGIFDGNVTLTTQQEVDDFGALCYSGINGILHIGNSLNNDINSLLPLINIKSVTHNFNSYHILIGGTQLTSLKGINLNENLKGLQVEYNDNLINFEGINLTNTIEGLIVKNNTSLESLSGLEELTSITNYISVENNNNLISFQGLNNVETMFITYFKGNNSLLNFQGFDSLMSTGDLVVVESSIINFQGLESLTQIDPDHLVGGYNLVVAGNPNLISLSGLDNLIFTEEEINIGGSVFFTPEIGNPLLADFCALQNLFSNGTYNYNVVIENNAYNPTIQDIQNGNCSQ